MNLNVIVGKTIKELKKEKGISQEKLAFFAKISVSALSLIERGITSPSMATFWAIARALDISPLKIVKKIENENPEVDFMEMFD